VRLAPALGRLLLVVSTASACATAVPSIGLDGRTFTPDADERALWMQGEREAAAILERVRLDDDLALTVYLARLGERLTPEGLRTAGAPALRVAVIRDPTLAVFALPDGRLFVTTGLLSAVESEAQLALVLAREIAHVVRRHALAVSRAAGVPAVGAAGVTPLGPTAAAIVRTGAWLVSLAARDGYGERREREADGLALDALARGGWDAAAAIQVYAVLAHDAGERGTLETLALGTPDRLKARLEALRALSSGQPAPPGLIRTTDQFEARRLGVSRDNAWLDVRAGRFALARRQLDRVLAAAPADARAHLQDGDWHRLWSQRAASTPERERELERARAAYARALALEPTLVEVHRQLGLLYYQKRDLARARAELQEYLRLAVAAPDAARIEEYVRELAR
jgi:predicted Zn-dependent protease